MHKTRIKIDRISKSLFDICLKTVHKEFPYLCGTDQYLTFFEIFGTCLCNLVINTADQNDPDKVDRLAEIAKESFSSALDNFVQQYKDLKGL